MWLILGWLILSILMISSGVIGFHLFLKNKKLRKENQTLKDLELLEEEGIRGIVAKFHRLGYVTVNETVVFSYSESGVQIGVAAKCKLDLFPWNYISWKLSFDSVEAANRKLDNLMATKMKKLEGEIEALSL